MIKHNSDFKRKFGNVFHLEPGGGLTYDPNNTKKSYTFPESVSEEQVEELMERSVQENKDLIIDLVKNRPVVYKPGRLY